MCLTAIFMPFIQVQIWAQWSSVTCSTAQLWGLVRNGQLHPGGEGVTGTLENALFMYRCGYMDTSIRWSAANAFLYSQKGSVCRVCDERHTRAYLGSQIALSEPLALPYFGSHVDPAAGPIYPRGRGEAQRGISQVHWINDPPLTVCAAGLPTTSAAGVSLLSLWHLQPGLEERSPVSAPGSAAHSSPEALIYPCLSF